MNQRRNTPARIRRVCPHATPNLCLVGVFGVLKSCYQYLTNVMDYIGQPDLPF